MHAPPDKEDGERRDEGLGGKVGFVANIGAVAVAVVVILRPDSLAPGERNREGNGHSHRNQALAQLDESKAERQSGNVNPTPNASPERQKGLLPRGLPTLQQEDDSNQRGDGRNSEENALDHFALGAEIDGQVENRPDDQEPADIDVFPDVAFGGERELRKNPGREQQERENLLRLVL